jgi:heptosyltransferase-2
MFLKKTKTFDAKKINPIKKVLIIQTAFIGDVILTLPLVQEAKKRFKQAEIHFLTIPQSKNLVETHPDISHLWIFDKHKEEKSLFNLVKLARRVKKFNYDLAIVPHRSLRSALIPFFAGIPHRIGFNKSSGFFLFNKTIKYINSIHEIDRNLYLLGFIPDHEKQKILPEIYPTVSDREKVQHWIKNNVKKMNIIAFAPGSVWPTKRWPAEYWGILAKYLLPLKFEIILIGSQADKILLPKIQEPLTNLKIRECFGKFSLRQTAYLLKKCRLLVCNDSAPTHLAVGMGTPVLTIFGPTIPGFGFYPYGRQNGIAEIKSLSCRPCSIHGGTKCPKTHFKCMVDLKPEIIKNLILEMLNGNNKN